MTKIRKFKSIASAMTFIIAFTILLDFSVSLLKFREQNSMSGNTFRTIETNSLQFSIYSQGIFTKNEKVLVASTSPEDSKHPLIFASSRKSSQIKVFRWKNEELKLATTYELNNGHTKSKKLGSYIDSNNYIFDLIVINKRLYFSKVITREGDEQCDEITIGSVRIDLKRNLLFAERNVWNYPGCIKWKDGVEPSGNLSLRLTTNYKSLFMTVGLEPVSIYSNIYPSDAFIDLPSSFDLFKREHPIFGSVLRIPILKSETSQIDIVANGLRSPQGFVFQRDIDGVEGFFISDHGPRGGDELNRLVIGKRAEDFGWPNVSLGAYYFYPEKNIEGVLPIKFGTHQGYRPPIFFWTPSIAPSQLLIIPDDISNIEDSWKGGELLLATLKDESIHKLLIDDQGVILNDERIFIGERIRDMDWLSGSIILGTDTGKILKVTPKPLSRPTGPFPSFVIPPTMQEVTFRSYLELRFRVLFEKTKSLLRM